MKENLVGYIKACQEAVDASIENENYVALDMGQMSLRLNLNGQSDLLRELIAELGEKYSVVKYLGKIID